jgi:hypothetical protein
MRSILIYLPSDLKEKLEQHPRHRYGKCNDFYVDILRAATESPQFNLDIASDKIRRLNWRIESLEREVKSKSGIAEMWRTMWQTCADKGKPQPGSGAPPAAAA